MGWHYADIMAAVRKRGYTLKGVALAAKIHQDACRIALYRRHEGGERAISTCIDVPLWELWPDRWLPDGNRIDHRTKAHRRHRNDSGAGSDTSCQNARAA